MSEQPDVERLEAEHGPCVVISHPDGSCFVFKALDRETFNVREDRAERGEVDSDDRMLQMLCVWPSRQAWNEYVEASAFETMAYVDQFRRAFGGEKTREAFKDELPEALDPSLKYFHNAGTLLALRRPGRAEVKMLSAEYAAKARGELKGSPLEKILRQCAAPETREWLARNLFGIGSLGDAFVSAFGMQTAQRVTGKR